MGAAASSPRRPRRDGWWHDAIGYAIYLRSFADADGDGVGDLAGVTAHLRDLAHLGADLVWVTPFYPSPMADLGYDVSDFCAVDPLFGDVGAVERLVATAHELDIRVVIDLVPNHTSREHPWFEAACADPTGPYRDYYLWRGPAPGGGPPNNWVSYFGGPAWSYHEASGQYYLHLFLPEQPDLNWRNPAVRREFEAVLRFWLDRDVDGFRIDVAQGLVKDATLRSNPQVRPWSPTAPRGEQWAAFEHVYDVGQRETLKVFESWRAICAERGAVLIGETYVLDGEGFARLINGSGLNVGFWFKLVHTPWDAGQVRQALQEPIERAADARRIAWASSSLDEVRAVTRLGGGDTGRQRALALSTLLFCLPGVPFLYQGEELGLEQGVVPEDRRTDPVGEDVTRSRDGCRTPMPWAPGPAFGFSTASTTWLPDGGRTEADTVWAQRGVPGSWYERYRALIALRRAEPSLRHAPIDWLELGEELVAFRRAELTVVANFGDGPRAVPARGPIVFSTHTAAEPSAGRLVLAPAQAVVVRAPR